MSTSDPVASSARGALGPGEVVVDVAAIRANARLLRAVAGVPLIAVVKADGYGHGMVETARAAREGGAEWLATATVEEALALRGAGDDGPLLCWLTAPDTDPAVLASAVGADVDVTAYSVAELDALDAAIPAGTLARVQLKVDTGLHRGGATPADWDDVVARARRGEVEGRWSVTGVWSHLSCSDEPDHPANDAQERVFRHAVARAEAGGLRPALRHLANSAATLLRPSSRFDAVRCGIALYGLDPAPGHTAASHLGGGALRPAMTVRAPLVMVKDLAAGDAVSYGAWWVAERATTVGLVPVGYGEGVPRAASRPGTPPAEVAVAGRRRRLAGTVCMDQVVVDLGGDRPAPGSEVVVLGPPDADGTTPTVQDWAQACGTISYEIVTRIGGRMGRRYVDSEAGAP